MVIQCFDPQIFHDSFNDIVQELWKLVQNFMQNP
jgi:hypothetical protein